MVSLRTRYGAFALAGVLIAIPMMVSTIAGIYRTRSPAFALKVTPYDAIAQGRRAFGLVTVNPRRNRAEADRLATTALSRDPTVVSAAVTKGLVADMQGDRAEASRWFAYADRLTRRDFPTHVWFIERAIDRGDIRGALARYDLSLRATPRSAQLLFGILNSATAEPAIARELNLLLKRNPVWKNVFLEQFLANVTDPVRLTATTSGLFDRSRDADAQLANVLLIKLVQLRAYDAAWQSYLSMGGVSPGTLRDGAFAARDRIGPFEWILTEQSDLTPEILPIEGASRSALFLPPAPGEDGAAARQLMRLQPGRWRVRAFVGDVPEAEIDRPRFAIRCAGDPNPIASARFARSSPAGLMQFDFANPNCPFVDIAIEVREPREARAISRSYVAQIRVDPN